MGARGRVGLAVIFPGQGTQTPGMGRAWRATPSWSVVERAESALGRPVAHLLLGAGPDELVRTQEAQLAVALASLLAWDAAKEAAAEPVAFAGHSLGQLTALMAAGSLEIEDGVRLIWERARCTQEAADANPGKMAALLGLSVEAAADAATAASGEPASCWVANDNAPGQVVLGGTPAGVDAATARARDMGAKRVLSLNVGGAFHTPLMAPARDSFSNTLAQVSFARPSAPVLSNFDAQAHSDADVWQSGLAHQLVSPVRWRESTELMAAMGARAFLEVGPGDGVLAGLARRTVPHIAVHRVAVPGDVPALLEVA